MVCVSVLLVEEPSVLVFCRRGTTTEMQINDPTKHEDSHSATTSPPPPELRTAYWMLDLPPRAFHAINNCSLSSESR